MNYHNLKKYLERFKGKRKIFDIFERDDQFGIECTASSFREDLDPVCDELNMLMRELRKL